MGQILIILQTLINPKLFQKYISLKKEKIKAYLNSNKDIPKRGEVNSIAGTRPINALINAVKTKDYYFTYFHWSNK